ncbi:MAG: TatD family hydrolase [Phycisphaeraceae bacterium]|nr:TatD family hydrolase [Phycisphaeraceae bacterium]
MIDTHCHLTFPELGELLPDLLDEAAMAGVTGCITISTTLDDAQAAVDLAGRFDRVWASAGVHPLYADHGPHPWPRLAELARHPKCMAWGELGLDNHYDRPPAALQRLVLSEQLDHIAQLHSSGISKPIILHCREAFDDLIPILGASDLPPDRMVFHCFTGTVDDARKCLDFGAMISFTGVVTYANAADVRAAAAFVPLDRLMVETDAPFLAPAPHRGKRPCRPAWVRHTAEAIAEIRHIPWPDFHHAINDNTRSFFGIDAY